MTVEFSPATYCHAYGVPFVPSGRRVGPRRPIVRVPGTSRFAPGDEDQRPAVLRLDEVGRIAMRLDAADGVSYAFEVEIVEHREN